MKPQGYAIRDMGKDHVPGLNKLVPSDWNFDYESFLHQFMDHAVFKAFVLMRKIQIIGTGCVFFRDKIGWLGNIIIREDFRNRGLGGQITRYLMDYLHGKACETQLLIATALGEPVYKRLGFRQAETYQCFVTSSSYTCPLQSPIRPLCHSDMGIIQQMDARTNAENRSHFIESFSKTAFSYVDPENKPLGFYLPDFGRGLIIAETPEAGKALLRFKHAVQGRKTQIPMSNIIGMRFMDQLGLTKEHQCSRMILGKAIPWIPRNIYSYGSGYAG